MNDMQKIAGKIPHEYRVKILMIWLPQAKLKLADPFFLNLWNLYFIYIEPNGVKKPNCDKCKLNVFNQWIKLQADLMDAEKEYRLLEKI